MKHLFAVQSQYGMPAAKGHEDVSIVKKFQAAFGTASPDGRAGPSTMMGAAHAGQTKLPLVMYWPKATTTSPYPGTKAGVIRYQDDLKSLARDLREARNMTGADALDASAARERGQAGVV